MKSHNINEPTVFTRKKPLSPSRFIRPIHPKTAILPQYDAIDRVLKMDWVGQYKIHGHRTQIHIPPKGQELEPIAYNRHGQIHKKAIATEIKNELFRLFQGDHWNVIDCEWIKGQSKLYVFDVLKWNGRILSGLNYQDRYALLPRVYRSEHCETLAIFTTASKCMEVMESAPEYVEGLVFRSMFTKGFQDTSIIRCRWPGRGPHA